MDNVTNLLAWIGKNEAVLSGVAAVIAITAVLLALSSRTAGLLRQRNWDVGGRLYCYQICRETS